MAKQNINTGVTVNDRSGDSLRSGANKINSNFNELYTSLGNGTTLQFAIDFAAGPAAGQTLQYDSTSGKFVFATAGAGTQGAPGEQGIQGNVGPQGETGLTGEQGIQGNVGPQGETGLTGPPGEQGIQGNVGPQGETGLTGSSGIAGSRTTVAATTETLNNDSIDFINITGFKSYLLLKIQSSHAAWIRIYTTDAARIADISRLEDVDPGLNSGVIAEVVTTGSETILIAPGVIGFNDEIPTTVNIPVAVTNKSGNDDAVTITLTIVQFEE